MSCSKNKLSPAIEIEDRMQDVIPLTLEESLLRSLLIAITLKLSQPLLIPAPTQLIVSPFNKKTHKALVYGGAQFVYK
eukprot:snap_masked-scaffold_43-processed-gene-1.85-mRNA-1 protein AED:1.00 eAED:1.00 QI:0/-1/0/0/-1/1/1/0/77